MTTTESAVTPALRRKVAKAGADFAKAYKARQDAADAATVVAREAYAAGMNEKELAAALGVDRARTLRRWLGKM